MGIHSGISAINEEKHDPYDAGDHGTDLCELHEIAHGIAGPRTVQDIYVFHFIDERFHCQIVIFVIAFARCIVNVDYHF